MEEKKDWEQRLKEKWYLWNYNKELGNYTTCENEVIDFIQAELDKAREEGMFDRFELSYIKTLHSEARAYRKYMGVTLTEEGEKRDKDFISKLSKLTTK